MKTVGAPLPDARRQRGWAIATAGVVLGIVLIWLVLEIPKGTLVATDELLTAERTREMLSTEPWVVHFNFQRSFEKPPLQYWLTRFTLPRLQNPNVAVRIWPLLYGALTAIALGWLVLLAEPSRPWLVPLSVAVLASCPLFSTQATRGLLDIGLAFFTTMAIVFAQLARRSPPWWLAVAAACWLGSLQKLPLPFLVCVIIVLVRLMSRDDRAGLRSGRNWLIASMILAIAAMSIWPLIQIIKYEMPVMSVFHDEIVVWLGPTQLGARPYFEIPLRMVINGGLCGLLALLAPFVILFSRNEKSPPAVREIAVASLAVIGLAIVSNFRHVRYVIPVVPVLCFLVALVFYWFLERGPAVRRRTIAALAVLLFAGFAEAKIQINHLEGKDDRGDKINVWIPALIVPRDVTDEKLIAEKLGTFQGDGTKIVLVKAKKPGADLLWDSFYLFHGKLRSSVSKYTVDEIRSNPPPAPLIGVCVARDLPVLQQLYPNLRTELVRAQFVCWVAAQ
ncbi:MAG TPA: phospholipid carrier-dependent glycosyltransferase [Chthoniobacterales bacterium]|nr:phospholipid carrier-dependent glycosyltransferase [Chthoniobacterales bacterium]